MQMTPKNKRKKVLVLTENFPPLSGGSGRWFWELYSRLPKSDYLIVADNIPEALSFDQTHDLNVIRLPLSSREWGFRSLQGLKFYFRVVKQLLKIIKEHEVTHIHTGRVIHEGVTAWIISKLTKVDYLCYVHGEDVETAATSREHNLMVKHVCSSAQKLICNSHNSANIVKRLNYASDDKIHILHPGVDSKTFKPIEEDADFKAAMGWQDKKVIITVGRLQQRKGQDVLIQAMPQILASHPDAIYAIIGRGECKQSLEKLIEQLNLQDKVQLLDEISDAQMIKCYQQCDLFVLPNRTIGNDLEGFGMVLVEAQACGKPVIAGDSGGTRETMLVNETGFIVDCRTPEPLATKISEVLADEPKLAKMGELGRQHVENELDWEAHTNKAIDIFK
ncbi:glycosyltransferase family 4 protein [Catenovulum sp. SX2]|uniref:glycosyltransferase family 4 protein n=1 Tax=Catenovulum sp. SX2 TaxID=3398614 RepID=UPI003F82FC43